MTKTIFTIVSLLSYSLANAQFFAGPSLAFNQSTLYNKSDKAADNRLNYKTTFKPAAGIMIGYQLNDRISILAVPQYLQAGQNFTGTPVNKDSISKLEESIQLNYLHLPAALKINVSRKNAKLKQHFLLGGYFSSLSSFNDQIKLNYQPKNSDFGFSSQIINYADNNTIDVTEQYLKSTGGDSITKMRNYKLSGSVFSKQDFGVQLGYGVQVPISNNLKVSLDANLKYGLAQVDNLDTLNYTNDIDPSLNDKYSLKQAFICRNNYSTVSANDAIRNPKSNNIFMGLQLSLVYVLNSKQKNNL
jgi:hypothetical protein